MGKEEIHLLLKKRKEQRKKVEGFRNRRINKRFKKTANEEVDETFLDEQAKRSSIFYNKVFQEERNTEVPVTKANINNENVKIEEGIKKISMLKKKQKKILKKMSTEKTQKGQPVMRNYIKYALNKLEETLEKEKQEELYKKKNEIQMKTNRQNYSPSSKK